MAKEVKMPEPNKAGTNQAEALAPANDTATTPNTGGDIQLTDDEKAALAQKRQDAVKAEQNAKIADFNAKIKEADARLAKYQGDDADTKEFREYTMATKPEAWKMINEMPVQLREDLKLYKLSILSPEQKQAQIDWDKANADLTAATEVQTKLRADILSKFPDFFGVEAKVKAPKKEGAATPRAASGESIPFTGVLLDNSTGAVTAKVKALHESGVTSETDIIRSIYPGDYAITNSKPRFQIHPIRIKLGYVGAKS